jgi:hypothetical protein
MQRRLRKLRESIGGNSVAIKTEIAEITALFAITLGIQVIAKSATRWENLVRMKIFGARGSALFIH